MQKNPHNNTKAPSLPVLSFIINQPRVASLRNDHQNDVNCLDFRKNPASFHAFVILHELNTLMSSTDAFIMYGIILADEGISFLPVLLMDIFFPLLCHYLKFWPSRIIIPITTAPARVEIAKHTKKQRRQHWNEQKNPAKHLQFFRGDLKSCQFSAAS